MFPVPAPRTWVAGEVVTAAEMNDNITSVLSFLLSPPICQVRQTVSQPFATSAFTALTFDTEDVDSSGMHSTLTNTERFTAVYPGWYEVEAGVSLGGNTTGRRGGRWHVNSSVVNGSSIFLAALPTTDTTEYPLRTLFIFLNVGDYADARGYQNSGSTLSTVVSANDQPTASVKWISN